VLSLAGLGSGFGQAAAPGKGVATPAEKVTELPVRRVSLFKNGVGFIEQAGTVSGNELVQMDFTTAQLNDALQSLTAVDLGDGRVSGAEYGSAAPLGLQWSSIAPGLGQDPTVLDFLHAMKGAKVEVRSEKGTFAGRLMNVEVRSEPAGKGGHELVERRYVSVISDAGGLRTFELTPSVEIRLVGGERQEIGRYLELLTTSHTPALRHLTLEDRGTGERELHVSYLSAVPAWKSSYRILLSNGKAAKTATLQGWAVVDNTSGADWDGVQLTLVSGAPQSFIQQISRPLDVSRPEIGMPIPGQGLSAPAKLPRGTSPQGGASYSLMGAMGDPIGGAVASVPMNAASIGGGVGVELHRAPVAGAAVPTAQANAPKMQTVSLSGDYERAADKTLVPQATSVDLDDLFEYQLSKPMTIRRSESATVPILQTTVGLERVTVWNPHPKLGGAGPDRPMRSLWLTNTSDLTLDSGSFSILENGMFGGQGQIDLMHPKEKRIVPYAVDEAVSVDFHEGKRLAPKVGHIVIVDGRMSVHRMYPRVREYTVHNTSSSARTVLLEPERTDRFQMEPGKPRIATVWDLSPKTPAPVEMDDHEYKFEVAVEPSSTATFTLVETHTHPQHYELASMHEDQLKDLLREANGDPEVTAQLQPLIEAKHQLAEIDHKLKADQSAMDAVKFEEKRIRENMAALPKDGSSGLAKRYADEMNVQEDKMESLNKDRDALNAQHEALKKQMEDKVAGMKVDLKIAG
jgi:hypothetical protein